MPEPKKLGADALAILRNRPQLPLVAQLLGHIDALEAELAEAKKIATDALEAIKKHQEVVTSGTHALSTTWQIADRALALAEGK
jgi:hypothetical protein